jgi:hypothetical protein
LTNRFSFRLEVVKSEPIITQVAKKRRCIIENCKLFKISIMFLNVKKKQQSLRKGDRVNPIHHRLFSHSFEKETIMTSLSSEKKCFVQSSSVVEMNEKNVVDVDNVDQTGDQSTV